MGWLGTRCGEGVTVAWSICNTVPQSIVSGTVPRAPSSPTIVTAAPCVCSTLGRNHPYFVCCKVLSTLLEWKYFATMDFVKPEYTALNSYTIAISNCTLCVIGPQLVQVVRSLYNYILHPQLWRRRFFWVLHTGTGLPWRAGMPRTSQPGLWRSYIWFGLCEFHYKSSRKLQWRGAVKVAETARELWRSNRRGQSLRPAAQLMCCCFQLWVLVLGERKRNRSLARRTGDCLVGM